ncbi:MAG: hypothetical protein ACRERE_28100 [Candidatus Entotheonellia bacterium]
MKLVAVLIVLTGVILAPVWGVPPAEACENCPCQGAGTGQASQMTETLTGTRGPSQTAGPVVTSNGALTTVGKLTHAVTRRFGAGHLLGISMPVYWR